MDFEKERSLTLFSSEGKLKQCEYAMTAASKGNLSVGARSVDGVVLCSLKYFSPLIDSASIYKVEPVCDTIGMTYSGLQPDFRRMHEEACKLVEDYKDVFGRYPFVDIFIGRFSALIQEYTQQGGRRPFGVSLIVCGSKYQDGKIVPAMFMMDPSGTYVSLDVASTGRDAENTLKYIENRLEMLEDNITTCVSAIRDNAGIAVTENDVDIGVFRMSTGSFEVINRSQVKELFEALHFK